jgi:YgiT-type zinc finger domain-containing protein
LTVDEPTHYPCPECQVGDLRPAPVTYFTVQDGQPVMVPDFPAWICDVCGRCEYDTTALAELRAVLDTSRPAKRKPRRPKAGGDPDAPLLPIESRRRP